MTPMLFDCMTAALAGATPFHAVGRVVGVLSGSVQVDGFGDGVRVGDQVSLLRAAGPLRCEVVQLDRGIAHLLPEGSADGVTIGDRARLDRGAPFAPADHWIGRVIDPDGLPADGRPLLPGTRPRSLRQPPPSAHARRAMGDRLRTGLSVFDTLLPLVRGQRVGLFSGSGVGKSSLLGELARGIDADVVVIALVGERGREVRGFVENALGKDGMSRAVIVAATSDRAPQVRRRCAWAATAVAEHFRDAGAQVLLLVDSVTRFAEAHRELAIAAGEASTLRGFPASTGPAIAALCERAGPGVAGAGDITAIYSVLVAGSDMEEPVADMLRGVLDGHVVLDRDIAERGRFPAIHLLRSVSRSLPEAATAGENALIGRARALLGTYERVELMVRSGLYTGGSDPAVDAAIACHGALDAFIARREPGGIQNSFAALQQALSLASAATTAKAARTARPPLQGM